MSEEAVLSKTSTDVFEEVLERRLKLCREILSSKAKEYAAARDRFHNFNVAGRILDTTPEKALIGMFMKHLVSVFDIVDNLPFEMNLRKEMVDEKIGDAINYLILLEGLLNQRLESQEALRIILKGGTDASSSDV